MVDATSILETLWARIIERIGSKVSEAAQAASDASSEASKARSEGDRAKSEADNAGESASAAAGSATEAKGHAERAEQMADPTGLRTEVMQQIADLVDGAPEDLDTIREVAEYAEANRDITDQLNALLGIRRTRPTPMLSVT